MADLEGLLAALRGERSPIDGARMYPGPAGVTNASDAVRPQARSLSDGARQVLAEYLDPSRRGLGVNTVLGFAEGPASTTGRRELAEIVAGRDRRLATAFGTSEQIPGRSTGLLPGLLDAPLEEREAFSRAAAWADATGRDRIYTDMGFQTLPSREGIGAYRNSEQVLEQNPVVVSRPLVQFVRNEAGRLQTRPEHAQALTAGEAVKGLLDMQEGSAWNQILTHPRGTSLEVRIGRMPTREEMAQLERVAGHRGFYLGNADDGANLLNANSEAATTAVGRLLRSGLRREIADVVPGATVTRGWQDGSLVEYSAALSAADAGQGQATSILLGKLESLRQAAPEIYERLLDSEGVAGKARENMVRLLDAGGQGQRPDYEELLRVVGEGRLRGLLDRVSRLGVRGLPAAGALGLGRAALSEDGASEPER